MKLSDRIAKLHAIHAIMWRPDSWLRVYMHQSRHLKPGFKGKEFYWHSDFETGMSTTVCGACGALSCSVLLTDYNACNGPLMLVLVRIRSSFRLAKPRRPLQAVAQEAGVWRARPLSLQLLGSRRYPPHDRQGGLRRFFRLQTMHGSNGNISPWPRANGSWCTTAWRIRWALPCMGSSHARNT